MTLRGSVERSRTSLTARVVGVAAAALLALALSSCDEGPLQIPPDPSAVIWTRVTDSAISTPLFPDWRADSIAFTCAGANGSARIAVSKSDGSDAHVMEWPIAVGTAVVDARPRWIRDGLVVFESNFGGSYDIWFRDVENQQSRRLTKDPGDEHFPAPRPTAPDLVYVDGPDNRGRLVLVTDTTSTAVLQRVYITPDTLQAGEPDWDPTGTSVCYSVYNPNDGTRHVWLTSLALGDTIPRQVTTGPYHDQSPRFSPDGTRIVFASDRTGRSGVWTVSPAGESAGLKLISFEDKRAVIYTPTWSPDGMEILLSSNGRGGGRALWLLSNLGF